MLQSYSMLGKGPRLHACAPSHVAKDLSCEKNILKYFVQELNVNTVHGSMHSAAL